MRRVAGSCARVSAGPEAPTVEVWPYSQDTRVPWRTRVALLVDPINLLFVDTDTPALMDALAALGWRRPEIGATHCAWVDGARVPMADHTALGPNHDRFHVRFWAAAGGLVVGAAHREVAGRLVEHVVTSWDAARAKVIADLCSVGWTRGGATEAVASVNVRGLPGDGRVWRVAAPEPSSPPGGRAEGRPTAAARGS